MRVLLGVVAGSDPVMSTDRARQERVDVRRRELEAGRDRLAPGDGVRDQVEDALRALTAIMLASHEFPALRGYALDRWLEQHKQLDV